MNQAIKPKTYFYVSLALHILVVLILILGFDFANPLPVLENTNQHDVISAVVLGDTAKSKIITQQSVQQPPPPKPVKETAPPVKASKPVIVLDKEVIALKAQPKKIVKPQIKKQDFSATDLLKDIKTMSEKQKQIKQKQLQTQFQKTLKQQAEQSLRQQLLNEDIKLQGVKPQASQGEVNKYKALILQAISQQWNVPPGADKNLHCALLIRLSPKGDVIDVQISGTSGNRELDSSARAAVLKASPLPVPPGTNDFEPFRQFVLNVRPRDIIDAG